jgi:outer membrane murein-binding lipoprotein Lpp
MKGSMIILVVVLGVMLIAGVAGVILNQNKVDDLNSRIQQLDKNVSKLNTDNTKLVDENIRLIKTSYLKSFENEKALVRFLQNSKTVKSFTEDDYSSEACISMMVEARTSGYWMGIEVLNMTDENIWSALLRRARDNASIRWMAYNVAVVGDADVYLVDPMDEEGYYRLMTIGGDFKSYYDIGDEGMKLPYDTLSK